MTARPLDLSAFRDRPVAVLGLARSGLAAATALAAAGARVLAWDDTATSRAKALHALDVLVDLADSDLDGVGTLVLSPGIPHTHPRHHPAVDKARAAGAEIICEVDLLARAEARATFAAVTGTNGKSTTTTLLGHLLGGGDRPVAVGGNLGPPATAMPALGASGIYVLELSSYQLELLPTPVFRAAVLLNISPDHLDRHGGMAGYIAAKRRVFAGQSASDTAIIGVDDEPCRVIHDELAAAGRQTVVPVSVVGRPAGGLWLDGTMLVDGRVGKPHPVLDLARVPTLPGRHNAQNAAAAYAAATALGLDPKIAAARLATFPGLAHRQELVATSGGVRFVNDSKATNADATSHALAAWNDVYWIAGGRQKEGGIAALERFFPVIRHAFLIGEAAAAFAATLDGKVATTRAGDLSTAVELAADMAWRAGGGTVLLSPACASFDQFRDFEARGDAFRAAATRAIDGRRAHGRAVS
ncbi:MAG: UDP-N-acetylmuramoyl-L-alanine--D-glutamate ligase [Alphaproteobacteria bacterium]|nr:UDP-N-acetylmuramoyl-L-alanine--D-glutamate ligase [Alphaproteobacteria bacterium]